MWGNKWDNNQCCSPFLCSIPLTIRIGWEEKSLGTGRSKFSGIWFRSFGCTSRRWPTIPKKKRNNRIIPFHLTIPARAQFLRTWLWSLLKVSIWQTSFKISHFNIIAVDWPEKALESKAKIHVGYTCNMAGMTARVNSLPRHSKVTLELVRKITRYRTFRVVVGLVIVVLI